MADRCIACVELSPKGSRLTARELISQPHTMSNSRIINRNTDITAVLLSNHLNGLCEALTRIASCQRFAFNAISYSSLDFWRELLEIFRPYKIAIDIRTVSLRKKIRTETRLTCGSSTGRSDLPSTSLENKWLFFAK